MTTKWLGVADSKWQATDCGGLAHFVLNSYNSYKPQPTNHKPPHGHVLVCIIQAVIMIIDTYQLSSRHSSVILGQKVSRPMISFLVLATTAGGATYASRGGSKQKKQEHVQESFGASSRYAIFPILCGCFVLTGWLTGRRKSCTPSNLSVLYFKRAHALLLPLQHQKFYGRGGKSRQGKTLMMEPVTTLRECRILIDM